MRFLHLPKDCRLYSAVETTSESVEGTTFAPKKPTRNQRMKIERQTDPGIVDIVSSRGENASDLPDLRLAISRLVRIPHPDGRIRSDAELSLRTRKSFATAIRETMNALSSESTGQLPQLAVSSMHTTDGLRST